MEHSCRFINAAVYLFLVTFGSRCEGKRCVSVSICTEFSTECDPKDLLFSCVLPEQEKNCSHEVTVVLFSRTFYEAKSIGV